MPIACTSTIFLVPSDITPFRHSRTPSDAGDKSVATIALLNMNQLLSRGSQQGNSGVNRRISGQVNYGLPSNAMLNVSLIGEVANMHSTKNRDFCRPREALWIDVPRALPVTVLLDSPAGAVPRLA